MFDEYDENLRVYKGVNIRRTNPYGFWVIDGIPELKQNYTQPGLARKDIDNYLAKPRVETKPKKVK